MRSRRSTPTSAAIATCRRSCASRSRTSSSTTRIWNKANGSPSCAGSTSAARSGWCARGWSGRRSAPSSHLPHEPKPGEKPRDRKHDGADDVEGREPELAPPVEQRRIEREGREGGVPAQDSGGEKQLPLLRGSAPKGEIAGQQAHHHRAGD